MKFHDIACAALPDGLLQEVEPQIASRWKGARIYMPAQRRDRAGAPPRNAAERFSSDLRHLVAAAGGSPDQAEEILTALSGGYFWV